MPELPEVENVVRTLRPVLMGRTLSACSFDSGLMARCVSGPFADEIRGRRVERIDRIGKWIFSRLDNGSSLTLHLGMTGRLSVEPTSSGRRPHTHLALAIDGGRDEFRFEDPRRFGEILLLEPDELADRFGPDNLGPDAVLVTGRHLAGVLAKSRRRLKAILLDQRVLAGVGNIYADEILFDARLHPAAVGVGTTREEVQRLARSVRRILERAILRGGSSIRDYVDAAGSPGNFQVEHRVYGRRGLPCRRCRSEIQLDRSILTGRSTHFCPVCQAIAESAPSLRARG